MTDEERLALQVQMVIDNHIVEDEISPSWIATQVMLAIEFPRLLHELGYVGCHLEVRQIARQKLRKQNDPVREIDDPQGELFHGTLQHRYPRCPKLGEEPIYVRRDVLTKDDIAFNVNRMRRASAALAKHADALEAWDLNRDAA